MAGCTLFALIEDHFPDELLFKKDNFRGTLKTEKYYYQRVFPSANL
jgi:hypothetical protein